MFTSEPAESINPAWELASVLAEITAFFFVTIDLYGEQRLAALDANISSTFKAFHGKLGPLNKLQGEPLQLGTLSGLIFHCFVAVAAYFMNRLLKQPTFDPTGVEWLIVGGRILSVLVLITFPPAILVDLTRLVPVFALWLLREMKVKGVLLACGSVLFVFAKGIIVVHYLRQVDLPFRYLFH